MWWGSRRTGCVRDLLDGESFWMPFLLGYDMGTSSIKAALLDAETGRMLASATSPKSEMKIISEQPGYAEQAPQEWWDNIKLATAEIKANANVDLNDVEAIGISYQMHGLVVVDKNHEVLRPCIIWCDGRAVPIGEKAAADIGKKKCLETLLNFPGNFTATRLKWIKENEPDVYGKIDKVMLPGDYGAMMMTGRIATTSSGISEMILWDFQKQQISKDLLDYYGFSEQLFPEIVPTFSVQGELTSSAADELGLKPGTKVAYRAGDQPTNAFSLNVLDPGDVATTAGTSGVVYGIGGTVNYDAKSRVNSLIHVNHTNENPRYGILLCVNGTGILNRWIKNNFMNGLSYDEMNRLAAEAPVGAGGINILPFGNGAERALENKDIGASVHGCNFNVTDRSHFLRAAQEGIVYALNYGLEIMKDMGIRMDTVKAGHANMFLSPLFGEAFATVTGAKVELYNTDGSQGAARGAGIGAGTYTDYQQAFAGLDTVRTIEPTESLKSAYDEAYSRWVDTLRDELDMAGNGG